ncbi:hypothetical protein JZ751_001221 [Albula glossodonta]|uniref:Uncharacterized protein n=1 Tax=Albula glossodonta TaxID=121402 RepID=A0A8T2PT78_9TELE|nr:hypothetical protein JZ751_001221 [Albula glossodonta]
MKRKRRMELEVKRVAWNAVTTENEGLGPVSAVRPVHSTPPAVCNTPPRLRCSLEGSSAGRWGLQLGLMGKLSSQLHLLRGAPDGEDADVGEKRPQTSTSGLDITPGRLARVTLADPLMKTPVKTLPPPTDLSLLPIDYPRAINPL